MLKIKSILITSTSASFDELVPWCKKRNITLIREGQIETLPITNIEIPHTDWLFLSSPLSAKIYLKEHPILAKSIACYGVGTTKVVEENGVKVDFTGNAEDGPKLIGQAIQALLKPYETILFPISQLSKRSISRQLLPQQVIERVIYQTLPKPSKIEIHPDVILFTSPSNYISYSLENEILPETQLVAMGPTTAIELKKWDQLYTLPSPDAKAFISWLENTIDYSETATCS